MIVNKITELFDYLFNEQILKNKIRNKWVTLFDYNYIDNEIIFSRILLTTISDSLNNEKFVAIAKFLYTLNSKL